MHTHIHTHTRVNMDVCVPTYWLQQGMKQEPYLPVQGEQDDAGRLLVAPPAATISLSFSLALALLLLLSFSLCPSLSYFPASLWSLFFSILPSCVLVPWPQSTPPTHTLMCHGLFRASLWCGRKLPSPGQPGATSAPPPAMSQAAETQPRH